jgi:hypothetical protein
MPQEDVVMPYSKYLGIHIGMPRKTMNTSVRRVITPAKIQTRYFLNTNHVLWFTCLIVVFFFCTTSELKNSRQWMYKHCNKDVHIEDYFCSLYKAHEMNREIVSLCPATFLYLQNYWLALMKFGIGQIYLILVCTAQT